MRLFTINQEVRLTCEMFLEISVFSAILRFRWPHCCSCIVRDFYLFSPFPTAKSNALCPVFSHRYTDSKLWLVYKRSLPGGLSKMAAGKFFGFKNTSREHMRSSIQSSIEISVFIYLVVFLLDFNSDFIMVSTKSRNFLDVCV